MSQAHIEMDLLRPTVPAAPDDATPGGSRATTPGSAISTGPTSVSSSPCPDHDEKQTQTRPSSGQSHHVDPASSEMDQDLAVHQPVARPPVTTPQILLLQDSAAESADIPDSGSEPVGQASVDRSGTPETSAAPDPEQSPSPLVAHSEPDLVAPDSVPLPASREATPGIEDDGRSPTAPLDLATTESSPGSPNAVPSDSASPPPGPEDLEPSKEAPVQVEPAPVPSPSRPASPGLPVARSSRTSRAPSPVPSPPKSPEPVYPPFNNPFEHKPPEAAREWERRKQEHGETSDVIDELMRLEGLEDVKNQFLDIKSKVDLCNEQGRDLKHERFHIVFQGNPGTGKTTVARLYGKFLSSVGVVGSSYIKETSGAKLCTKGSGGTMRMFRRMLGRRDGGTLFVDEAYQLTAPYMEGVGRSILDLILTTMENNIGKLAVVFVGYKDEMESLYEHNPGLSSRIPHCMNFADFSDAELCKILVDNINRQYKGKMKVEDGMDGLYMRIAIRRLSQARGSRGFGNAREVNNLLAKIANRQARRIAKEKREGKRPDPLLFSKEDMIGFEPSLAAAQSPASTELQKLIGLESVKKSVQSMIRMTQLNYHRELNEQKPLQFSLNQLFVGAPGTGKTTVAKLYGRILADIGLLSRGDVVLKTPADFIGECLGKSEAKTKKILEATVGKVLVIDEAYMLDAGDASKEQDKFKTGVIDTLVAMIQGVPGEDRCIILVGYEDRMNTMFQNVNPGLSRRFPITTPFRFENFDLRQLQQIMQKKMGEQDIEATAQALETASDVLERALMRPNFTNAGEVDAVLSIAKRHYEMRQSAKPVAEQAFDGKLEPQDFDKDHDRGTRDGVDSRQELRGRVHDSIIEKLAGYQARSLGARRQGLKPREHVPTNFVFKGFPGTGKTVTAQHMGKIFYDMGFLATPEVIEVSATDMLGQYVGQTCPKTRKILDKAIGKVLFIDEAWRLIYGQYAAEAVDEMIQFLAKPSHAGKMVVILAGYKQDMHCLMRLHPVLSGLFPEEIAFENLLPQECITLLLRDLDENQIETQGSFLRDPSNGDYAKVNRLFQALQVVPGWGNARDVKYLAKQMLGKFLVSSGPERQQNRVVTVEQVVECLMELVLQRRDRCLAPTAASAANMALASQPPVHPPPPTFAAPQQAPPQPAADTTIDVAGAATANVATNTNANRTAADHGRRTRANDQHHHHHHQDHQAAPPQGSGDPADICVRTGHGHGAPVVREAGTSDADWAEVQAAKKQALQVQSRRGEEMEKLKRSLSAATTALANAGGGGGGGGTSGGGGGDLNGLCDELRGKLSAIQKLRQDEERLQAALQLMGRCVNGYAWNKVAGGWRCEGGMHFVADVELAAGA